MLHVRVCHREKDGIVTIRCATWPQFSRVSPLTGLMHLGIVEGSSNAFHPCWEMGMGTLMLMVREQY